MAQDKDAMSMRKNAFLTGQEKDTQILKQKKIIDEMGAQIKIL